MARNISTIKRKEITFFEGINSLVGDNLSKKQELFFATNARSNTIGYIEKRNGYRRLGDSLTNPISYGIVYFDDDNASSKGFYRISSVNDYVRVYYLNTNDVWTALWGNGMALAKAKMFFAIADKKLFMANGSDLNRYLLSDGVTIYTSGTTTGHLYNCPKSHKIAYYKQRIYIGDYYVGSTRYPTSVMMSSPPLGILSLIDGDHTISGATVINVTDTKYIRSNDTLDIYRGNTKVAVALLTAKTERTITATIAFESGFTTINSSDELWVANTFSGERMFRWTENPQSGIDVKQYDTFRFTGGWDDAFTMFDTIGDVLIMSNKNNIGTWNNFSLRTFNSNVGCVSDRGYTKGFGALFFIGYRGLYMTDGNSEPELLSAKIQKYFDGATKSGLEGSAVGIKGFSILASIGNVTLYKDDGSVDRELANVVIEFNLRQKNWFIHTGINAIQFANYVGSINPDRLEFISSSTNGNVYDLFTGNHDDDVTNERDIPFEITTSGITLASDFERICYPKEIILEVKSGSGIKCYISLDGDPFFPLQGQARKGVNIFKVTSRSRDDSEPRCRVISISFREMSGKPVKISRVAIKYAETGEEEIYHE
jgi:hypothetical protein